MLTCLTALAYTLGPLTVALIVNTTGLYTNRWSYHAVFCAQFSFAAVAAILVPLMPESPTWLVSKDRQEAALKALAGLGYKGQAGERRLANTNNTLERVRKETEDVTYLESFRKSNLRRTIISIMPLSIQALSGVAFTSPTICGSLASLLRCLSSFRSSSRSCPSSATSCPGTSLTVSDVATLQSGDSLYSPSPCSLWLSVLLPEQSLRCEEVQNIPDRYTGHGRSCQGEGGHVKR
ncbi:hypothetical protein BU25DRAFT_416034 [Macroventuria anomochaeta]|uniref:Uncharacterized protein n=1 Tax=Macroventuria anomochaeta TaxID=301207 RepID=A0ACB6RJB9_9PLEO|nr:uncharacterized protein BU25DRAFT_416034 [Macroventuria anomochaeta]KAF2621505.1 hypothetical protein BU25DRAFT_416034 [Macroventuria anomochaeta]